MLESECLSLPVSLFLRLSALWESYTCFQLTFICLSITITCHKMCVWTGQTWSRLASCNFKLHELFNLLLLLPHLLFNVSFAKAAIKAEKAITMPKRKERERKKRRRFLLCHSTISICVIMRKIKALHIICPTSPHLLTAPLPQSLSLPTSLLAVSLSSFWLLPQSMSCSVSLTTICSINYACLSWGRSWGRGGQSVYRVYSGWPGDASLKCHLHLCGKLITFINNTPSECHRRTMGQAAAACAACRCKFAL